MAELKVFTVISAINALMDNSRKVPLSNTIFLDRTRMSELLDQLEESLDPDLEKAEKLLAQERELLESVERRARETTETADRQAKEAIDQANQKAQEAVSQARMTAEDTVRQATEHANQLVAGAQAQAAVGLIGLQCGRPDQRRQIAGRQAAHQVHVEVALLRVDVANRIANVVAVPAVEGGGTHHITRHGDRGGQSGRGDLPIQSGAAQCQQAPGGGEGGEQQQGKRDQAAAQPAPAGRSRHGLSNTAKMPA